MIKSFAVAFVPVLFLFIGIAPAQTVSIVSGNGQIVCPVCPGLTTQTFAPMVVLVTDSSGKPMANTTVTWTATPGQGAGPLSVPTTAKTTTNSAGQASATIGVNGAGTFNLVLPYTGYSFLQTAVTAAVGSSMVGFTETTAVPASGSPGPPITVSLLSPLPATPYTGTAGQTSTNLIKVSVFAIQSGIGGGLSGVALQLLPGKTGATLSCQSQPGQQPGTVLTDSSGNATCTPVFGPTVGTGTYQISVGGVFASFLPGNVTVTAGPPALIKLISGNNQSINPGMLAPGALVAEVTDLGGNPAAGGSVTWTVTPSTATLSNTVTTSPSTGQVSARVTVGGSGPVLVTAALAGTKAQVTFTINVNVVISALQSISGNNQTAMFGMAFADPLVVQVNNGTKPVAGVTVNFAASGDATLSAASATTDSNGQAQVTVTAGSTAGTVTVTASVPGVPVAAQTFTLTVVPPGPQITADGFTNAASFQPQFISPCSLATIFGTGIATGIQGAVVSFIEPQMQLAGVSVQFAGIPAPVLSVVNENGQESVSVQVPCEVTPGSNVPAKVTVGTGSTTVPVTILPVSPGIFQTVMSDGQLRAVLVRPDGSFVSLENPAQRGEIIRMFCTGLGQTTPALTTNEFVPLVPDSSGALVPETLPVNAQVVVGINTNGVREISANYAYGMVGVYEVQFQVPSDTQTGNNAPLAIVLVYPGNPQGLFGNPSLIPIQ